MKKVIVVAGARPNFIKISPLIKEISKDNNFNCLLCHTGQHFDHSMSEIFFKDLGIPPPDYNLGVSGGTHAQQSACIMLEFEKVLVKEQPDLIIVVGDVNSTMSCSLVASKLNIKVAHIEAGLRSKDSSMPEEINRIITDSISDYLFVSEKSGLENLSSEGISDSKVFFVGNIMIDSLIQNMEKINKSEISNTLNLSKNKYILATFHRPSNVDEKENLQKLISLLNRLSEHRDIIFPIHPRTKSNLDKFNLIIDICPRIKLINPIGYIDFQSLIKKAEFIITDSGGIQEETSFLSVPCLTMRDNTERPVTVSEGTNILVGTNISDAYNSASKIFEGDIKKGKIPELWDGRTSRRIINVLKNNLL